MSLELSKFDYFMKRTEEDLKEIKHKLDVIYDFRLKVVGGSILLSVISSILVSLAYIYFGIHEH